MAGLARGIRITAGGEDHHTGGDVQGCGFGDKLRFNSFEQRELYYLHTFFKSQRETDEAILGQFVHNVFASVWAC